MAWIAELIEAIDAFDPEFRQTIMPADPADVKTLSGLLGVPLPNDYTEFIEVMGASDGGLFWMERVCPDLPEVIDYCRRHVPARGELSRPRCVPFAVGIDFDGFGLRLDPEAEHPPVVILEGILPGEQVSKSLPALAWSHVFQFEQAATGHILVAMSLERRFTIENLEVTLATDGYHRCWFSEPNIRFLRKGAALLTLRESRSGILRAYLGSLEDAQIVDALAGLKRLIGEFQHEWVKGATLPDARLGRRDINDFRDE
jgi:hypothetical protein